MSNSQCHIPETGPSEQLEMGVDQAKSVNTTDSLDQAALAAESVQESLDLTPLEMAYSTLTLLEQNKAETFVTQHWLEDASIEPRSLIETLYERTLRNLILHNIAKPSGETLEYEQSQPQSLSEYPSPEDSFAELTEDTDPTSLSDSEIYDVLDRFTRENGWPDIVIVQHILYLVDEVAVDPADTALDEQFRHAPPSDEAIPFVFTSLLYHLTGEALRSGNHSLTA